MFFLDFLVKRKIRPYAFLIIAIILLAAGTIMLRGSAPDETYVEVGDISNVISIQAYEVSRENVTIENETRSVNILFQASFSETRIDEKLYLRMERPTNLIHLYVNQSVLDSEPRFITLKILVGGSQDFAYSFNLWKLNVTNDVTDYDDGTVDFYWNNIKDHYCLIGNWILHTESDLVNLANLQIYKGVAIGRNKTIGTDLIELRVTDEHGKWIKRNTIEQIEIKDLTFVWEKEGRVPSNNLSEPAFFLLTIYFISILFFLPFLLLKKNGKSKLQVILILGFILRIGIAPFTSHSFDILGCKRAVRTYYEQGALTLFSTWTSPPTWFFILIASYAPYACLRVLGLPDVRIYYQPVLAVEVLFMKLPLILADLLSAYMIYHMCKKRNLDEGVCRLAAAVYMFNPFSIFISSTWGMFDSLAVSFALLGLYFSMNDRFLAGSLVWGLGVKWYSLGFIPLLAIMSFFKRKKEKISSRLLTSILIVVIGFGVFALLMVAPHALNGDMSYLRQVLDFRLKIGGGGEDLKSVFTFFGPVVWRIFEGIWSIHPFPNFFLYTFGPLYVILLAILLFQLKKRSHSEEVDSFRVLNNAVIATLLLFYLTYPQLTPQCILWIFPSFIFAYFIFHQISAKLLIALSLLVIPYIGPAYFMMGFPALWNIPVIQEISYVLECVFGILLFSVAINFLLKITCPVFHQKVSERAKHLLQSIRKHPSVGFFLVLLFFNLIFASNYLFSSSDTMPGFSYRQDAYGYMMDANHLVRLSREGFNPFVIVSWFDRIYCGFCYVFTDLPLQLVYLPTKLLVNDFILAYKITLFVLYLFATFTMYYLTYLLTRNHLHSLVSTTVYAFSQVLVFEVILWHLSMVFGYALIPLIIAAYLKVLWGRSLFWVTLCGAIFSILLIIRPDFGYFTFVFLILLALYHVFVQPQHPRIRTLKCISFVFILAFCLSFPFLSQKYIFPANQIAPQFSPEPSKYNYMFYSPKLEQYLLPISVNTNAYLGVPVISLSIIGLLSCFRDATNKKVSKDCKMEPKRFYPFISLVFLIFFLLSLGNNTCIYGFLHQFVPYFSVLRVPTRWLVIAQVCLSILAGNGVLFLADFISKKTGARIHLLKKHWKTIFVICVAFIILLDYSFFIVSGKSFHFSIQSREWHVEDGWASRCYLFPPTSDVPPRSDVYKFLKSDGGSCRVLVFPNIYTIPYFYYLENLQQTDITFSYGYGYYHTLSIQEKIYQTFLDKGPAGDYTENLEEEMALLGVKYVILQPDRPELNLTKDDLYMLRNVFPGLKYITNDDSLFLFRNTHFRDAWSGFFAVVKLNDNVTQLLSEENEAEATVLCYEENSMDKRLEISTTSPFYIIMSQSYNDGWQVFCEDKELELTVEDYRGLCCIYIPKQGEYTLNLKFVKYWNYLVFSQWFYSSLIVLLSVFFILSKRSAIGNWKSWVKNQCE